MQPHFIYNALNTIKWVAVLNHQENIQKLIESLNYVLMNAARDDEAGYCVEDELKLVENYAVIQKARGFESHPLRSTDKFPIDNLIKHYF